MHTKALITDVVNEISKLLTDIMLPIYKTMSLYFKHNQGTTSNLGKMFRTNLYEIKCIATLSFFFFYFVYNEINGDAKLLI